MTDKHVKTANLIENSVEPAYSTIYQVFYKKQLKGQCSIEDTVCANSTLIPLSEPFLQLTEIRPHDPEHIGMCNFKKITVVTTVKSS